MAGRFRHHLARNLPLRVAPTLEFVYDESMERAGRIASLLEAARRDGGAQDAQEPIARQA